MSPKTKAADLPFEADFNRALDLWHAGELAAASVILETLATNYPNQPTIHGTLGGIYYQGGRLQDALPHLQRAVSLSPHSQLAARVLFHTLHDLGRPGDAREELMRFLSVTKSSELRNEWRDLLAGLGPKG